jgi:hypothetical protein
MDFLSRLAAVKTMMDGRATSGYKRLPGKGARKGRIITPPFSRCSLYLGDDHILAVDNHSFSEDYRRFYFADIQAIITRKTRGGAVWSIVLAFMIACSLAAALFLEKESIRIFSWSLSGAFLAILLINILRGPSCICHILTAVQEDQLPSLHRLRLALRVIDILRLAIEKVQGRLSPEEVTIHQSEGMVHPTRSLRGLRQPRGRERQIRHYDGTVHMIAFALILADGLLIGIDLLSHSAGMIAVSSALGLMYSICVVIALVKQYGSDIPGAVRRLTWASLCFIFVSYCLSHILMVTTVMARRPKEVLTQWDMYRALFDLSPRESPFLMGIYLFAAACSLTLGVLGLIGGKKHRDHAAGAPGPDGNRGGELRV